MASLSVRIFRPLESLWQGLQLLVSKYILINPGKDYFKLTFNKQEESSMFVCMLIVIFVNNYEQILIIIFVFILCPALKVCTLRVGQSAFIVLQKNIIIQLQIHA